MIAACCDREAVTYRTVVETEPRRFVEGEEHHCLGCRRAHGVTDQGPKWIRSPFYCAHPWCGAPIFRFAINPRTEQPTPLWPDPTHIVAEYEVTAGPTGHDLRAPSPRSKAKNPRPSGPHPVTWQHYCSEACAPLVGDPPPHPLEEGGDPHRYRIHRCIRVSRAATWEFCQQHFTDQRGEFFRLWLADYLHLPTHDRDRLMTQWVEDRRVGVTDG